MKTLNLTNCLLITIILLLACILYKQEPRQPVEVYVTNESLPVVLDRILGVQVHGQVAVTNQVQVTTRSEMGLERPLGVVVRENDGVEFRDGSRPEKSSQESKKVKIDEESLRDLVRLLENSQIGTRPIPVTIFK
jgi:hypothetical protein